MESINLSTLYSNMQAEMLQTLRTGVTAFAHSGTKGDNTEVNWIEWFRKYLPARYAVDKAIIIDSNGKCSDQIDLVIYDTQYSYLVFQQQDSKLIPAESVRTLFRSSAPIQHAGGQFDPKPLHEILAGILTTKSDWVAPIAPKVAQYVNSADHNKRLDFVCSISNNTFVVNNNIFGNQYEAGRTPTIHFCEKEQSLVFLLLNLLKRLQDIGTVPAIDYTKYADIIDSKYYKDT